MRIRIASTAANTAFRSKRLRGSSKIRASLSYPDHIVDDEQRWHSIGLVGGIAILLVVHTSEEQHGEEEIRIVSARKASSRERALYDSTHA